MLEIVLCSLLTIVPDYLYRRYGQGKRLGHEITIFSVWFELRWGITSCLMLAVSLITIIFYFHPSTTNVTGFFRTIPIIPEASGRVSESYVGLNGHVEKGAPIFKLDSSKQEAAVESARRRIAETDAAMAVTRTDVAAAEGQIQQAQSALQQSLDELDTKQELNRRNPGNVPLREIERLQVLVEGRKGGLAAAVAAKQAAETRLSTLIPAEKASAEAALAQAQVDLDKTVVYAGVTGRVEQFVLRVGDIVNPLMRPAGILIPVEAGRGRLQAGFAQIEAQVMKVGMIAEVTCVAMPFTILPRGTGGAGFHRGRSNSCCGSTDRRPASHAAGNNTRQRLYQQSRVVGLQECGIPPRSLSSRCRCAQHRSRADPAGAVTAPASEGACFFGTLTEVGRVTMET